MVTGAVLGIGTGTGNTGLPSFPVTDLKTSAANKKINYLQQYQGMAKSVLLDNQDGANAETVRINNNFNTITIPASAFRTIDDQWIEQIELAGTSTNMQVTAQIVPRVKVGL